MLKSAALRSFGTAAAVARALKISQSAVFAWRHVVPLESALALELLTNGAVRVDQSLYPKLARAARLAGRARRRPAARRASPRSRSN